MCVCGLPMVQLSIRKITLSLKCQLLISLVGKSQNVEKYAHFVSPSTIVFCLPFKGGGLVGHGPNVKFYYSSLIIVEICIPINFG